MLASNYSPLTVAQERKLKQKQWVEKLKRLEEKEEWLKQHPLIPEYNPRLSEPASFWLVFFRQKQAFECATGHPQDVHTFAFEPESHDGNRSPGNKGLRKYVVTSYAQLWHSVRALSQMGRHGSFYEVIPEGAACKLYFDLEFKRDLNPEADGGAMVQTLIQFVKQELLLVFEIHCHDSHVINLDASTGSKFSCHLIFNIPGAIFQDNIHAGHFVRHICSKISTLTSQDQSLSPSGKEIQEQISTGTDNGILESDDSAINRDTRDHLSPPAKRKRGDADGGGDDKTGDLGGRTSEVNKEFGDKDELQKLFINVPDGEKELFIDTAVYTRNRNFRLYKCVKLGKENPLVVAPDNHYKVKITPKKKAGRPGGEDYQLFLDSIITNVKFSQNTRILTYTDGEQPNKNVIPKKAGLDSTNRSDSPVTVEGYQASPFPEIDAYVRAHCISQGGVVGDIRRWTYFSQAQLIVYDIVRNRWCENIGRPHRSNNIMIMVDVRKGVYYQKCHDPACRTQGFKSSEKYVPPEHLPSFTDWDDEELISLTEQVEQDANNLVHNRSGNGHESLDEGCLELDDTTDEELIQMAERLEEKRLENGDLSAGQRHVVEEADAEGGTLGKIERRNDNGQVSEADTCRTLSGKAEQSVMHQDPVCTGSNQNGPDDSLIESSNASANLWDVSITDDELLRSFQD